MSFITRNLKQTAVYWAPGATDIYGKPTYGSPTAVKVRWEDKTDLFIDFQGREQRSLARVYLKIDVVNEGYLFLGTSTASDPTTVTGAREIRDFRKIPNLAATAFERRVLL